MGVRKYNVSLLCLTVEKKNITLILSLIIICAICASVQIPYTLLEVLSITFPPVQIDTTCSSTSASCHDTTQCGMTLRDRNEVKHRPHFEFPNDTSHPHCWTIPDNKFHGANMGPTLVLSAPAGPHVGPLALLSEMGCLLCVLRNKALCFYITPIWKCWDHSKHIVRNAVTRYRSISILRGW